MITFYTLLTSLFYIYSREGQTPIPRGYDSERVEYTEKIQKYSSPEPAAQFNQTWYKSSLDKGNSTFFKFRTRSSLKGR
jgi:hypothetical protein